MRCNHTYKKCLSVQILIEDKKAVGVSFIRDGRKHVISAKREVILSGGSVSSPQILMLSGIGPKEHLQSLGVSFLSIDLLLHGSKKLSPQLVEKKGIQKGNKNTEKDQTIKNGCNCIMSWECWWVSVDKRPNLMLKVCSLWFLQIDINIDGA